MRSWSTFNEPGVFAFSGYVFGSFPPGRFMATRTAGLVVKHMLIAHTEAYNLIKSLPGMRLRPHLVFIRPCTQLDLPRLQHKNMLSIYSIQ